MKSGIFRFKQFDVSHFSSSMRIGVDAVLTGAWADVEGAKSIIDVGTGCGVIALMCAQRNPDARILAIDIDGPSIEEATDNFHNSPWNERLEARNANFITDDFRNGHFDVIISNPPYFEAGMSEFDTARKLARHQGELSPHSLLGKGSQLLNENGVICMIVPYSEAQKVISTASQTGLWLRRRMDVSGKTGNEPKRSLLEFSNSKNTGKTIIESLAIETAPCEYTSEYISLTKDFYLKF